MPEDSRLPPQADRAIRIRAAQPSDLGDLTELEIAAFASDRLSRRRLRAFLVSHSATMLIACGGDSILGYALVLTRQGSRAARLYSIAVATGSAGQGIGSLLLAAAEDAAAAGGALCLNLEVRGDNLAAIRLYERKGYRRTGRRENYYQDGMAALRYSRQLDRTVGTAGQPAAIRRAA